MIIMTSIYDSTRTGSDLTSPLRRGFTLIELLVVTAVIAILASMLLGGVGLVKSTAQSAFCKNNVKQLMQGWFMYAHEHEDRMAPNKLDRNQWGFDSVCPEGYANAPGSWVLGDAMSDADPRSIRDGVLFQYNPSLGIYHCPSDKSNIDAHPGIQRIRSYAMSYCMNGDKTLTGSDGYVENFPLVKEKTTQLANPARLFVFIDEAAQAIKDGTFFSHYPGDDGESPPPPGPHWMDVPADRHMQGCNLTFADGHAERVKWRCPKGQDVNGTPAPVGSPDFQDLRTLQQYLPDAPAKRQSR